MHRVCQRPENVCEWQCMCERVDEASTVFENHISSIHRHIHHRAQIGKMFSAFSGRCWRLLAYRLQHFQMMQIACTTSVLLDLYRAFVDVRHCCCHSLVFRDHSIFWIQQRTHIETVSLLFAHIICCRLILITWITMRNGCELNETHMTNKSKCTRSSDLLSTTFNQIIICKSPN